MTLPAPVAQAWETILRAPDSLGEAGLALDADGRLVGGDGLAPRARALLEIFLPLQLEAAWVVGQLGQSLDGRIATESGHSHYINGPEDIRRLHGLRALADAVVVGPGTAASDDPRLTARELPGPDPVRVVLDPRGSLSPGLRVFTDGGPPTLWIRGRPAAPGAAGGRAAPEGGAAGRRVTVLHLPGTDDDAIPPDRVLAALRGRGFKRVLVEGGGRTVSAFLRAGLLDRLHICVAPLLIGSGRPGITLPAVETLDEALRPRVRHFPLGEDLLFDLELSGESRPG